MKRFSLRSLLCLITLLCIACVLIRYPTQLSVVLAFSASVGAVVLSIAATTVTRGLTKAYAMGFAIVGTAHLMLAFMPLFAEGTDKILISRYVLNQLAKPLGYSMGPNMEIQEETITEALRLYVPNSPPALYYKFIVIGQSLMTLLAATMGGLFACYLHHISSRGSPPSLENPPPQPVHS